MFDIRESAESSAVGHQCDLPAQLDFHVLLELKQRSFVIFWDVLYHYKCSFNKKEIKMRVNCEGVYDCNDGRSIFFYSVEWFRSRFFPFFFQLLFFFKAAPFILEHRVAVFAVARSEHTSEPWVDCIKPILRRCTAALSGGSSRLDLLCIVQTPGWTFTSATSVPPFSQQDHV